MAVLLSFTLWFCSVEVVCSSLSFFLCFFSFLVSQAENDVRQTMKSKALYILQPMSECVSSKADFGMNQFQSWVELTTRNHSRMMMILKGASTGSLHHQNRRSSKFFFNFYILLNFLCYVEMIQVFTPCTWLLSWHRYKITIQENKIIIIIIITSYLTKF